MVIKKGKLTRFGHVECHDDIVWIKRGTTMEAEGTKPRRLPMKTCGTVTKRI